MTPNEIEFLAFEQLRHFKKYSMAAELAKDLAQSHKTAMVVRPTDTGFCVLGPSWVKKDFDATQRQLDEDSDSRRGYDDDEAWAYDREQQRELNSIVDEVFEYADDMERSNDDGWFYPE